MISFRSFSFRSLFTLIFSLLPTMALAAGPTYDLISPIGGMSTGVDLPTYLQNVIIITIGIAGVLAVVMLVICGIKIMMSGSVSGKSAARECIWNAIFGLLIAAAAWALLYTINPELLKNDLTLFGIPISAGIPGGPSGGPITGVSFSWAAGPTCPPIAGKIASIVPPSKCAGGGAGVCCAYISVPSSSPIGSLPPPSPGTPPPGTPPPPPPPPPISPPPVPGIQLNTTGFSVSKTASVVVITVIRTGPTTGTDSVDFTTIAGTAISGINFTNVSGTLTFAPGVTKQTFSVPIIPIPSATMVGNKKFTVNLSNPSPGVTLGTSVGVVTIIDTAVASPPSTGDTIPPVVTIINPAAGFMSSTISIPVDFSVSEDTALKSVILKIINNQTGFTEFSKVICSDFTTLCPALGLTGTEVATIPAFYTSGNFTVTVTACDMKVNCATASVAGQYVKACPIGNPLCKTDFLALQNCIGQAIAGSCIKADLDKNGIINSTDLLLLANAQSYDMNKDGIIDTTTLTTNFTDTCSFHTTQDPLLPCAIRVMGNVTLTALDKTTLGAIYNAAEISFGKFSLALIDAGLCATYGCTTAGSGLGGTDQLSIYGESMLTTFRGYDFNNDGIIDGDPAGPDMIFFQSCVTDPTGVGCVKADIDLDGFVTNSDLNLLLNAIWAWQNKPSTLSNLELMFWGGTRQPEAGIMKVCQGAEAILLCGAADLNKDGVIDATDTTLLAGANIYDINGDGIVVYTTPTIPVPVTSAAPGGISTKFVVGDLVATANNLIVRAAPGDASQFLGIIPTGSTGSVIGGPIFIDGNWWWKIAYTGSFTGWSVEPLLNKILVIPTPPPPPSGPGVSTKFVLGERVGSTANLNVRATAGLAGMFLGMIPGNTTRGNIIGGPTLKDGYWWWQVKWDSGISGWSAQDYMKEFTPPPAPKITAPANNSYIPGPVTIIGTMPAAEVGGTVSIQKGIIVLGTAIISTTGSWNTILSLADGTYTIDAIATDQSGNVGPASTPLTFTIDTIAPNAPIVTSPGSIVAASTITITGTASEAGTIYVYSNSTSGTLLGTVTTSGATNAWTFSKSGYINGTYTFAILEHDLAGNIGPVTTKTVQVAVPPPAPNITAPISGLKTNSTSVTVSGTGAAVGDTINLYSGVTLLGTATLPASKTWSITLSGLTDGARTIYAIEVDTTMVASAPSTNVTFTVDTIPPAAPVISAPGATVNTSTFTMSGTAELFSTIFIYANNTFGALLGTTVTNAFGNWAFTLINYVNGSYTFAATARDVATNISPASSVTTMVSAPPPAPLITAPLNGSQTNQKIVSGTGFAAGNTISLFSGATLLGTTVITAAKTWSISLPSLIDGAYTVNAVETDTVSISGPASANVTFTLDTVAPAAPAIVSPAGGATVAGPAIISNGTGAVVGNLIKLYVSGVVVSTSSVDGALNWNGVVVPVPAGTWTFSVTETDAAGNESAQSAPVTITVT